MVPKKRDSVVWEQKKKKKTQIETRSEKLEKQIDRKYEQKWVEN